MQKPSGYDSTEAKQGGQFDKPKAGAYVMKILKAQEVMSKTNRPMLVLLLDIATGEHAGNFRKLFDFLQSKNPDSKWPCVYRRCMDGEQTSFFKGDIKAIEESNPGFKFNFDEKTLAGKLVGCALGEKETDSTGKIILEPRFLCSSKKAASGEIKAPALKTYAGNSWGDSEPPYAVDNTFQQCSDYVKENLPF
jgi:hypothetical protein